MGTGSSKNNNVVAFGGSVEKVPIPGKTENDQNGNKTSSWQDDVKKEQKSRSRLGVRVTRFDLSHKGHSGNFERILGRD